MFKQEVNAFYERARLFQYKSLFNLIRERDGSLSATEAYAVDVINILGEPTIKQFSEYIGISQSNASYKIGNLIAKGYITKEMSEDDRREYHLRVTDKFRDYYAASIGAFWNGLERMEHAHSPEELEQFTGMLRELMDHVAQAAAENSPSGDN